VEKSQGLSRTRELARTFRDKAVEAISPLQPSSAKDALIDLADLVLKRQK
jgi:geranylgeranyl pyrophosphate synthase